MSDTSSISISALVQQLAAKLLAKNLIMATAESCTGGCIAQSLTAVAGSSNWFDSGFVTYSNAAKQRLLNVPAELFASNGPGAVSEAVVLAMTAGAVWIAWQYENKSLARCFHFKGDRGAVRKATAHAALEGSLLLVG